MGAAKSLPCFADRKRPAYKPPEDQELFGDPDLMGHQYPTTNWLMSSHLEGDEEDLDEMPNEDEPILYQDPPELSWNELLREVIAQIEDKEYISKNQLKLILYDVSSNPDARNRFFDQISSKADEEEDGSIDCEELRCIINQNKDREKVTESKPEEEEPQPEIELQPESEPQPEDSPRQEDVWALQESQWETTTLEPKAFISQLITAIYSITISELELTNLMDSLEIDEDTGKYDFDEISLIVKNYFDTEQKEMP